ncbi:hypothetical protein [Kribbella deserti]|uniref:Uncharacterized protein n=1 Tax=Kribbella deserti TaxID=1926257 RepID=A0ABV6QWR5_9ACTN
MTTRLADVLGDHQRLVALARADASAAAGARQPGKPREAFDALRDDLRSRGARLADGSEVRTRAKALQWLAEGIEASRAGNSPFELGAPVGTRRLLYSGNVIDPETNQTVALDPSRPAEPGNELHSGAVARAITTELPDTMTLEQTRDGALMDGLRLYENGTRELIADLRATDSGLDAAISRIEGPGEDPNAFADATWNCLSGLYAEGAAADMRADPALECGVVTSQLRTSTVYARSEYPALAGMPDQIVYSGQVRTTDGAHSPLPGGLTDSDLRRFGRGVDGGQLRVLDGLARPGSAVQVGAGEHAVAHQRGGQARQQIERD